MGLLTLIYPEMCAACDALCLAPGLCPRCAESLYATAPCCPVCALPEDGAAGLVCRRCRRSPPPFARTLAPWRYGGELAVAIRRYKYGGARGGGLPELARPLAALLAGALVVDVDVVVPVPLHRERLVARGFSQAHLLARLALRAARVRAPLVGALTRLRATDEQAGLTRAARAANVSGAFTVPAPAARAVAGRRVLLVDDVITTGATASACARALRHAGAAEVTIAAVARAEM
jgi:ComF family protein